LLDPPSNKGKAKESALTQSSSEALYTFSADITDEKKAEIEKLVSQVPKVLEESALMAKRGPSDEKSAFDSERVGDLIHVWVPANIQTGDVIGYLILGLCCKLPNVVLHHTTVSWKEPNLTPELERRINGIIVALQGPPKSFNSSSSPVDITCLSLWISAIGVALSKPGGQHDAVGSVVPVSVYGGDSANKYLAKGFAALRAVTDESELKAIKTLEQLLQLWRKEQEADALNLLTRHKIPWGAVLTKGAPTEKKKVKKQEIISIVSPPKPSKSPWLSGAERTELQRIFKEIWEFPDYMRKAWNVMSPQAQHANYHTYVAKVRSHYELMKAVSSSAHAKLGHRKKWIEDRCRSAGVEPKAKKEKGNMFIWTQNFFKLSLRIYGTHQSMVRIFAPNHYLGGVWEEDFGYILEADRILTDRSQLPSEISEDRRVLWGEWVDRFNPYPKKGRDEIVQEVNFESKNFYGVLGDESEDEEDIEGQA
jgi:hypothetical protein